MSYAIVRVQKFKAQAVRGIQAHDQREKEKSHTNPDINRARTPENYTLAGALADYGKEVTERLDSLGRTVRKDAVVMCQALVTSDHLFFQGLRYDQQRDFFQQSLNFLKRRYGEENVISATVHMDERTPHMHVNFVPIRDGKLSAFSILTRKELTDLQTDFAMQVGLQFGLQRGEQKDVKRRHIATPDFKRLTLSQLDDLSIAPQDLEPRVLEKTGFLKKDIVESAFEVANRLSKKYIYPLAKELRALRLELEAVRHEAARRKAAFEEKQELERGLSADRVKRLRRGIEALSETLKSEEKKREEVKSLFYKAYGYRTQEMDAMLAEWDDALTAARRKKLEQDAENLIAEKEKERQKSRSRSRHL